MLSSARRAGRSFLVPYLRRIAAQAAFGAIHHIFLWAGDILFSYAVAAMVPAAVAVGALAAAGAAARHLLPGRGLIPGAGWAGQIGFGLIVVLLGAWFLRSEAARRRQNCRGTRCSLLRGRAWCSSAGHRRGHPHRNRPRKCAGRCWSAAAS
jgi:hypothetical protein